MLLSFSKWPKYRGGHISGFLIRGSNYEYVCQLEWLKKETTGENPFGTCTIALYDLTK